MKKILESVWCIQGLHEISILRLNLKLPVMNRSDLLKVLLILLAVTVVKSSTAKLDGRFYFLEVDGVPSLNYELTNIYATCPCGGQELLITFSQHVFFNQSIDILNHTYYLNYTFVLSFRNFKGFVADRDQFLLMTLRSDSYITLSTGVFEFYSKRGELLDSSCDSYLMSYYGLRDEEYQRSNKIRLFEDYSGLFSFGLRKFVIKGQVAFGNLVCPLIFKYSYIEALSLIKFENSGLVQNYLGFSNLTESIGVNVDLNCTVAGLHFFQAYRLKVDAFLFNEHVFMNTVLVNIDGTIGSISLGILNRHC